MSFTGSGNFYNSVETVDEVAEYTDMQGQASQLNGAKAAKGEWKSNPAKQLVLMWVAVFALYTFVGYFFRAHRR